MDNISEKSKQTGKPMVTIIAPVYNEIENIHSFYTRLEKMSAAWERDHEIIFVDDGSSDGSKEYLFSIPEQNHRVRVIRFGRNFGQENALMAGFDNAKGDILLIIDVDLQVIPEDIPRLIDKIDEGYDVVAGYRPRRDENVLIRRLPSKFANFFFKRFFHLPYRDLGCGIQAFRRKILEGVDPFSAMYSYRIMYACWRGGRFADIPVEYHPRSAGETKYDFSKLAHLFLNLMLTFLIHPYELVFFFVLGAVSAGAGLTGLVSTIVLTLFSSGSYSNLFMLSLFLLFSGLILILFGFLNERINRINHQINKTPVYVIDSIIEPSIQNEQSSGTRCEIT